MDELFELLKIPSISTLPAHEPDMKNAREYLTRLFTSMGFATQELKGDRHNAVFANLTVDSKLPTVLIYGHYDVQPPDPLELWLSPPFEPTIRNGYVYARGATDDKGQLMIHIMAAKQLIDKYNGKPPVNFKFFIEGEEEIGSVSIARMAQEHKELLTADYLVLSDTEMPSVGQPAIHISLRGLVYLEIRLTTADHDMHSGQFGGVAPNPAIILAQLISQLKNDSGKILIPGFYDDVSEISPTEKSDFALLEPKPKTVQEEGSFYAIGGGEDKLTLNQRRWSRPTLDVNGMISGFTGEGSKTIIPGLSMAKISMRLVPNQDPQKITQQFSTFVKSLLPSYVKLEVIDHASCLPYKAPTTHPVFDLLKKCLSESFGQDTVFYATGGSIGFVPIMAKLLGIPALMPAMGNTDDDLHAPNEHFRLENYTQGIAAMTNFYSRLSKSKSVVK